MQKFLLVVFVVTVLFLHMPQKTTLLCFDGEYTFCTFEQVEDKNCKVTKNGSLFLVCCDSSYAQKLCLDKSKIVGESTRFCGDKKVFESTCKQLGKTRVYQVDGLIVAEGFCQRLPGGVDTKNGKINFQVSFDGMYVTVGTPTISTGF